MVSIELRTDGWFDAGEDRKDYPIVHMIYHSKQKIKRMLEEIGDQPSIGDLEKALHSIDVSNLYDFKGTLYLDGDKIMVDVHGLPGTCYLGKVK
jgi:hypothetical protein